MTFENKLVAILNKDIAHGVVTNVLAHMSIGLGDDIRKTVISTREHKIEHTVFLNTMTGGTYIKQKD